MDALDELRAYTANHFQPEALPRPLALPLAPEPHVDVWREYAATRQGLATAVAPDGLTNQGTIEIVIRDHQAGAVPTRTPSRASFTGARAAAKVRRLSPDD